MGISNRNVYNKYAMFNGNKNRTHHDMIINYTI